MKKRKIVLLFVVACLLFAVLRSCFLAEPVLTVQILAGEQEADITEDVRFLVGYVQKEKPVAPTPGNITLVSAEYGTKNKFVVPAAVSIGVFVIQKGKPLKSASVRLRNAEHRTLVIRVEQ